jgi:hypothetical protein
MIGFVDTLNSAVARARQRPKWFSTLKGLGFAGGVAGFTRNVFANLHNDIITAVITCPVASNSLGNLPQ